MVGLSGNLDSLRGNIAEDANANSRTWERVAVHERFVDAELSTNCLSKG